MKSKSNVSRVTGPRGVEGEAPQAIKFDQKRLENMLNSDIYIDSESVDACLSLIDRKLSEDCAYVEGVTIHSITSLRLIATGNTDLVKDGHFLTIIPRKLAIEEEAARMNALKSGLAGKDVDVIHYTLVSNIHCGPNEVNVYETLSSYRQQTSLLTIEQRKLVKSLLKAENDKVKVNCINVLPQIESECGAISVGLAVKLCFSAPEEKAVFEKA